MHTFLSEFDDDQKSEGPAVRISVVSIVFVHGAANRFDRAIARLL